MESLWRLAPYLERYRLPFWAGIAGLLLARVFEALIALLLKHGIDRAAAGNPALLAPAVGILLCVIARFGFIVASRRLIRRLGIGVAYDLRKRVFAHLQLQGPSFFSQHGIGDLMARAINDVQLVRQLVGQGTRTVLVLFFSAAVGFAFMLGESWQLTLLILPPLPIITFFAYLFSRRIFRLSTRVQEGFSDLSDRTQENLNGIRTVQALGQEPHEIERFHHVNDEYANRFYRLTATNSLVSALMPALGNACTLVIIAVGGSQVLAGTLSIGSFAAFLWYVGMVLWPVREAGNMVNLLQRGASATTRLFEILDTEPEIQDRAKAADPPLAPPRGEIEIRDLHFRYPGAPSKALDGIQLRVPAGDSLAVIGRVGSGKSTLLKLLVRLLESPDGEILLDGRRLADWPLAQLRESVALVSQDTFLFATRLDENVSYHAPNLVPSDVEAALEDAQMADTVAGLAEGPATEIGERGVTLSGGQKQRTTLARGLIRHTPVLLLDDCFSSVDTNTEDAILRRLRERRAGLTTFIVSHRVSTVKNASQIVVLDEGRIVERGTHASLLQSGGLYATLEAAQSRRGELMARLGEEPSAAPGDLVGG